MSASAPVGAVVADLAAEHAALDAMLDRLGPLHWSAPTASPGWSVADQVGHLGYFDRTATLAIDDADTFAGHLEISMRELNAGRSLDSIALDEPRRLADEDLFRWWRQGAAALDAAARLLAADRRLPWYGPPMGARSFLTARLMETWAHGHDIADAVGEVVVPTHRLEHIARLGSMTRKWSYTVRGATMPDVPVLVRLDAPSGDCWSFGEEADDQVLGPAIDFCLVVTQRRHVEDTALVVLGDAAAGWMEIAQAFAGAATLGPPRRNDP